MRRWLEQRDRDGLTFRELSAVSGVPAGTLAYWSWKLRCERVESREERASTKASATTGAGFVELVATGPSVAALGALEIVLGEGRRIIVTGEVNEDQLARVVRALCRC